MSEPTRKAKPWILFPWIVFLVAIVGWSAWWVYGSRQIGQRMDAQAQALRAAGYTVSWSDRSVGGFPFRYAVKLGDVQLGEPAGWGLSAPSAEAYASAVWPDVIVFSTDEPLTIYRPGRPALVVRGEEVRASLGGLRRNETRVSLVGRDLVLGTQGADLATFAEVSRFEAHMRRAADNTAEVSFRIHEATPAGDTLLARVAGGRPVTVALEGELTNADVLYGGDFDGMLSRWSAAGGYLSIEEGGIAAESALVSLRPSAITADAAGFARGDLRLTLARATDGVLALGEIGVLPPETAAVASGLAAAQSAVTTGSGVDVTFEFHDGETWFGPVPLGPAPRLYATGRTAGRNLAAEPDQP
jgi:hypothetical protein